MNTTTKEEENNNDETGEFSITFRNGALRRLKRVAADMNIPEERLSEVLSKSVNLLDIAREGNTITIKKGKDEYVIHLRDL